EVALEFHSVPVPRIVTGGDDHSAGGVLPLYGQRYGGSGCVIVRQFNRNARRRDHIGRYPSRIFGDKPCVIADYYAGAPGLMLEDVGGNRCGHPAHVGEGEIVGDDTAPSIRSELDFRFRRDRRAWLSQRDLYRHISPSSPGQTSLFNFFSSRYLTTLPTSCAWRRVVISSASSVSTTTMSVMPTAATNFPGAWT